MTARIITARADRMTAAQFHALFEPRRPELHTLVAKMWEATGRGDREEVEALREALSLVPVERGIDPETGNHRVAA